MSKHRWIQKATASIKRRGTAGKCTPISKPGCTGRARALALTFKAMSRKRKADGGEVEPPKKPIYTNDPNDPRLKVYQDSLEAFNIFNNIMLDRTSKGLKKRFSPRVTDFYDYKGLHPQSIVEYSGKNIIEMEPYFKKPTQPVIYKPTVQKPKIQTTLKPKIPAGREVSKEEFERVGGELQSPIIYREAKGGVVGNKISLLMKEGYPQKQAVAIALDMQRRGKLEHGGKIPEWLYDARGKAMRGRMRREIKYKDNISKYSHGGTALTGFASGAATGAITGGAAGGIGALPGAIIGGAAGAIGGYIKGRGAHKAMDKEQEMREQELLRQQLEDQKQEELLKQSRINYQAAQQEPLISNQFSQPNVIYNFENIEEIESPYKDYAKDVTAGMYAKHGGNINLSRYHNLSQEDYNKAVINVEKDELEVKGGKVLTDYKAKPRHPEDENEVDFYGNTLAKPGNIIIPREKREAYLKGDKITRNTIEVQLQRDQNKREKGELSELRSRNQYLKSLSENVRRHISATGKKPVEGTSPSIFPPEYGVGLKDLDLYNLGGCVGCHKDGGRVRYQDGSTVEKAPAYEDEFGYENFLNSQLADYYGKSQAGYNVPQYSPAVSTAQTKFDPFYNPGTANFGINKPVGTSGASDNKFGFSDFAQYAAPAYNIGMGLFGKTPQAEAIQNPYTERVKDIMSRRRINMSPVYEGIGLASAGATRQLRGYTGGSAGLQLQGMQNIQNIESRNRANAAMQEQIANMGFRGEEASTLNVLGQQDVQGRERQRQLQLAMEANKAQFIPKGIEQFSTIAQGRNRDTILKEELEKRRQAAIKAGDKDLAATLLAIINSGTSSKNK